LGHDSTGALTQLCGQQVNKRHANICCWQLGKAQKSDPAAWNADFPPLTSSHGWYILLWVHETICGNRWGNRKLFVIVKRAVSNNWTLIYLIRNCIYASLVPGNQWYACACVGNSMRRGLYKLKRRTNSIQITKVLQFCELIPFANDGCPFPFD
jgi:hypothetical protein